MAKLSVCTLMTSHSHQSLILTTTAINPRTDNQQNLCWQTKLLAMSLRSQVRPFSESPKPQVLCSKGCFNLYVYFLEREKGWLLHKKESLLEYFLKYPFSHRAKGLHYTLWHYTGKERGPNGGEGSKQGERPLHSLQTDRTTDNSSEPFHLKAVEVIPISAYYVFPLLKYACMNVCIACMNVCISVCSIMQRTK